MEPPVLGWIFPNKVFDGLSIFCCYPFERVFFVGPFFGHDDPVDSYLEEEAIAYPPAVADYYRHVIGYSEQTYAFIGTCFAAEEIYEHTFLSGVLVGYKTQG